jgi:hypothetical protein
MSKQYKNVSLWYNRSGVDTMYYVEQNAVFTEEFFECSDIVFVEGLKVEQFVEESRGNNWVMYAYDGVGVLCSDMDVFEAYDEYEEAMKDDLA